MVLESLPSPAESDPEVSELALTLGKEKFITLFA
jgi:hypothetical protein